MELFDGNTDWETETVVRSREAVKVENDNVGVLERVPDEDDEAVGEIVDVSEGRTVDEEDALREKEVVAL